VGDRRLDETSTVVEEAAARSPSAAAAARPDAPLDRPPDDLSSAVIERIARRTARHVDSEGMRLQLIELLDDYLGRITQELGALRRDGSSKLSQVAEGAAEIALQRCFEGGAVDPDRELCDAAPPASAWRGWLVAAAAVIVLGVVLVSGITIYQTAAAARSETDSGTSDLFLDSLEWALNAGSEFDYGVAPFDDARLAQVRELWARLNGLGFRGTVRLTGHVGRFCLAGSPTSGFALARPELALEHCDRIGQPAEIADAMSMASSNAFAEFLLRQQGPGAPIRLEVLAMGDTRPALAYPKSDAVRQAGDWNAVARRNNRVQIELIRDPAP
jgi:hypothetical protein